MCITISDRKKGIPKNAFSKEVILNETKIPKNQMLCLDNLGCLKYQLFSDQFIRYGKQRYKVRNMQ